MLSRVRVLVYFHCFVMAELVFACALHDTGGDRYNSLGMYQLWIRAKTIPTFFSFSLLAKKQKVLKGDGKMYRKRKTMD